ncbi:aminopeptidase, partial [Candidatus Bathyarchaeota archaeon]
SIHLAFGANLSYGGTSKSCMHWDFVTYPSATIENAETGELIMKNGRIL